MIPSIRIVRSRLICLTLSVVFATFCVWNWKGRSYFPEDREVKGRTIFQRNGKVVILLSNQRSGSTFVGEFFNRFEKGFYLYEPLLPFTPNCNPLQEERLELLKEMSHCDFRNLPTRYKTAESVFHVKTHRECHTKHMCAPNHHPTLLQRYSNLCHAIKQNPNLDSLEALSNYSEIISKLNGKNYPLSTKETESCTLPLNLTLSASLCYSAEVVGFKILRVCSLSSLEEIAARLTDMGSTVYVVELVRDPRAIVNSALKLELKRALLDQRLDILCGRYRNNLQYVKEQSSAEANGSGGIVTEGRYMRVRYEDIASDPVKGAAKIYSHIGIPLPKDVKEWIEESSVDPEKTINELRELVKNETLSAEKRQKAGKKLEELIRQRGSPYGTVRDSQTIIEKWRKQLPMEVITRIQDKCADVMDLLGYKLIKTLDDRNDLKNQLW